MHFFITNIFISFTYFIVFNQQGINVGGTSNSNITLNLQNPSFSWNITSNTTNYSVELSEIQETTLEEDEFKISLIIEVMSCSSHDGETFLDIQGNNKYRKICENVDNLKTNFQTVHEIFDDEDSIEITPGGNWSNDTQAYLVVSVYIEKESCETCPDNFFCCGTQNSSCITNELKREIKTNALIEKVRCIPVVNNNNTFCNGHPNCGFFCNSDEIPTVCNNPWKYFRDIADYSEGNTKGSRIEVVWKSVLFFATCLLIMAAIVILTSFCNAIMLRRGIFSNYNCKFVQRKPLPLDQKNLTFEPSFRYSDEYM